MNEQEIKEVILNRAEVEEAQEICNHGFVDDVVFLMKDKDHAFSIGLSTIMECLEAAILNGDVPKLPQSWCSDIREAFNLEFSSDATYYDG